MNLSRYQIENYRTEGYLSGIPIASQAEAENMRSDFNELEEREGRDKCQKGLYDPHFRERFTWQLATDPRLLDCVESLIGPNILLMATHFFCKYGPSEAFVAWHQDVTYWGLEPPVAVSAWLAIDDSDAANGCMQVVPGSHNWGGIQNHGKAESAGNLLSVNQQIQLTEAQAGSAVDVELRAGEISLHDGLIVHGSQPNRSTRRRCGLAMVYIPTSVKQMSENSLGGNWQALLVRGENRESWFRETAHPFPLLSDSLTTSIKPLG